MHYRPLGSTGLHVSEIGFGTGDNAGLMVRGSEREQHAVVARALELGINYFDTSPDYGKGLAEINLGKTFRALRADAIVCTKVEIMPEHLDDIAGRIARSLDESLDRLQMDAVDLLMIHNAPRLAHDLDAPTWTPLTPEDFLGPALEALEAARAAGKIGFYGIACDLAEPAAAKPLFDTGYFSAINANYSLVNPSGGHARASHITAGVNDADYEGMIVHAGMAGVGVAVIRPLAGGALSRPIVDAGAAGRHTLAGGILTRRPEFFAPDVERGRAFAFLDRPGRSLAQAATAFVLMLESVTTVLGGYSDISQLEEIARVPELPPLTRDELVAIDAVYARNFDLPAN
jgi:aryl-alcohol dehydrogenase-like predicted oxidoreductase